MIKVARSNTGTLVWFSADPVTFQDGRHSAFLEWSDNPCIGQQPFISSSSGCLPLKPSSRGLTLWMLRARGGVVWSTEEQECACTAWSVPMLGDNTWAHAGTYPKQS